MHDMAREHAILAALASAWDLANGIYLRGALRSPVFALMDSERALGQWNGHTRTLSIARSLVYQHPWGAVCEVLRHEMAHQYAQEVLGVRDESPHGGGFVAACRRLAVDPIASGPVGSAPPDTSVDRAVAKIHKLLALAASPNRNEAEAAMRAARRRMLEHQISGLPAAAGRYLSREIGEVRERVPAHERLVAGLLAEHFFVRPIWVQTYRVADDVAGSVLEVSGTPDAVDVAEYVHGFLLRAADTAWRAHRDLRGLGDRDRRRFLSGVIQGFHEKLRAERPSEAQAGLVWVGDPGLERYIDTRHPRLRRSGLKLSAGGGFEDGRRAGRALVLHRGVSVSPSGGPVRRLGQRDD